MAETIKLPLFGAQKESTVIAVGAGVVVVLGVAYYRVHKSNAATAATATTATQIDPATGYAYGSPEDATALAGMSQYQNPVDYGGGGGPASSSNFSTPQVPGSFTNNAQWSQAAESYLSDIGLDETTVSAALGRYLSAEQLSDSDVSIVEQAIAVQGYPPISGSAGYPPNFKRAVTSTGTATTAAKTNYQYTVQIHQISVPTGARALVERFSAPAPISNPNSIEIALRDTVADPHNQVYRDYYVAHGGVWPAQAKIYLHVVSAA